MFKNTYKTHIKLFRNIRNFTGFKFCRHWAAHCTFCRNWLPWIQLQHSILSGADIIGLNCQYDPNICIKTMRMMKEAIDKENLQPFLMLQPLGFHVPEAENIKGGYHELPEFPIVSILLEQLSVVFCLSR